MQPEYTHIGSGGFGCVVTPVPPCELDADGEPDSPAFPRGTVAKLCTSKAEAAYELWMAAHVRAVDPEGVFTLLPGPAWCRVPAAHLPAVCRDNEELWADARAGGTAFDTYDMYRLTMPYGGVSLLKTRPGPHSPAAVGVVLGGLVKLAAAGIAHLDLHENNVLVDEGGTLRIIDFGGGKITTSMAVLGTDLLNFYTVVMKWFRKASSPQPAVSKRMSMLNTAIQGGKASGCLYARLVDLWRAVWDPEVDDDAFDALLGVFRVRKVQLRARNPLDDLRDSLDSAVPRCGKTDAVPVHGPEADAVVAAWDAYLTRAARPLAKGVLGPDALRAHSLVSGAFGSTGVGRIGFWHQMAVLAPVYVALAAGGGVAGASSLVFPDAGPVLAALQEYAAAVGPEDDDFTRASALFSTKVVAL